MNLILALSLLAATEFGYYWRTAYWNQNCPGGRETATITLANSSPAKISGALVWSMKYACGPGCTALYTQPYNLPPLGRQEFSYSTIWNLTAVDIYVNQAKSLENLSGRKGPNYCEQGATQ